MGFKLCLDYTADSPPPGITVKKYNLYVIIYSQAGRSLTSASLGRTRLNDVSMLILLFSCNSSHAVGLPYLHSQRDGKVNNLIPAASATWWCEDPSAMPPLHQQTSEGNGNLQKWCEIIASPPFNPGETSRRSDRCFFLCFSRRSSDVEFGGVCGACVCVSLRARGRAEPREWEAGRAVGKNCTPSHGARRSRNGEEPERVRESGRRQRGVEIYSCLASARARSSDPFC